jgi:hypothetical protein
MSKSWGITGTRISGTRIRVGEPAARGSEGQEPGARKSGARKSGSCGSVLGSRVTQIKVGGSAARGSAARESELGDQGYDDQKVRSWRTQIRVGCIRADCVLCVMCDVMCVVHKQHRLTFLKVKTPTATNSDCRPKAN